MIQFALADMQPSFYRVRGCRLSSTSAAMIIVCTANVALWLFSAKLAGVGDLPCDPDGGPDVDLVGDVATVVVVVLAVAVVVGFREFPVS